LKRKDEADATSSMPEIFRINQVASATSFLNLEILGSLKGPSPEIELGVKSMVW
jgi:hypothetical protein